MIPIALIGLNLTPDPSDDILNFKSSSANQSTQYCLVYTL